MALVRDRCICLRVTAYSETSQILTLFGREHGLVRVIAKGARRRTKTGSGKFDGGVDLLDLGEAVFTHAPERELGTLTEWCLRDGHLPLRGHLRALYLGQYAAELVSLLVEEHDPHPDLFDRLQETLLELASRRVEEVFLAFELDLLRQTGYLPQMSACVLCGHDVVGRAYFSPMHSGVVCRDCEGLTPDRVEFDPRLVRVVQGILRLPQRLPQLTRQQTDPINRLLLQHIEHTLSRRLRMGRYVVN